MTLSNDCPCGRSQLLTSNAGDTDLITIDRETLRKIAWDLALSRDGLREIELQQEFIAVVQQLLKDSDQQEQQIDKALLFLDSWFNKSPDGLGIVTHRISKTHKVLTLILAASKAGSND